MFLVSRIPPWNVWGSELSVGGRDSQGHDPYGHKAGQKSSKSGHPGLSLSLWLGAHTSSGLARDGLEGSLEVADLG